MATATRSVARKRHRGGGGSESDEDISTSTKKSKMVKWEWLGDGGKWTPYSDTLSDKLTDSFTSGANEVTMSVSHGVKMKIKFKNMTQSNVSTGWPRDVRCVPLQEGGSSGHYQSSVWEWEEGGVWKSYPESTKRQLEAAHFCDLKKVGVVINGKNYHVDLSNEEMEMASSSSSTYKIRRVDLDSVWQWEDDGGGVWINYSTTDCQTIETAYSAGKTNISLTIMGRNYSLDLSKMTQVNTSTNVSRNIKRVSNIVKTTPTVSVTQAQVNTSNPSTTTSSPATSKGTTTTSISSKATTATTKGPSTAATASAKGGAKKGVKKEEEGEEEEEEVKSKPPQSVKSQVFSGDAPVDTECHQKIGKAQVYSEGKEVWNCMLNQTNLKNNNNKFYLLQLLKDNGKSSYSVWFRWGRVGKSGQHSFSAFGGDLESAKDCFRKKFQDKTQNSWENRHSFVKVPGKYDLLEMDYEAEEDTDAPQVEAVTSSSTRLKPVSKLDKRVQDLINMICDVKSMEDVIKEMKYDVKKAPLGKLNKAQIKSGYAALKKIESLIAAGKTSGDDMYKACDEFYTRVPHDFGMRRPPLITTKEGIKQKLALLEALGDIQIAMSVLQKSSATDIHPLDQHYSEMHCQLTPLEYDNDMLSLIKKFVKQTHGKTHINYSLEVQQVFEVRRQGEEERFKDVGNRQLLWHGSRLTNWMGILSQGLRIAPPEAPVTGYMFGKGLYFADICSKSANYCFATPTRNEGLLLLSEVSLGTPNELLSADCNAHQLPKGTHSVKGLGRMEPNPAHNVTLDDGCVMPLGLSMDTGVVNSTGYTLNYNEYIVYDTSQVKMKYLVLLKFKFT